MSISRQFPATASGDHVESEKTVAALGASGRQVTTAADRPALSVIIPVRNDPENLDLCLQALRASEYSSYEVIVVDDASTDATPEVARSHGVRLLRQESRSGPAAARNRGAGSARHPYLFFLDADVGVRPSTLGRVAARFVNAPSVDAFFGSYDASPGAPNFVSQYRNLLHHHVHQAGNARASTFWSGCGAIKSSVFLELGGFDTSYANASIEDIELGSRLRRAGHQIALDKSIQVQHLKRWTLWRMVQCDIQKRGIPWTLLALRQGKIPNDLNLRYGQRFSAVLSVGVLATLALGAWYPASIQIWWMLCLGFLLGIVLLNRPFYALLSRVKNPLFAIFALPLHVIYYLSSCIAFAAGVILHLWHRLDRGPAEPR